MALPKTSLPTKLRFKPAGLQVDAQVDLRVDLDGYEGAEVAHLTAPHQTTLLIAKCVVDTLARSIFYPFLSKKINSKVNFQAQALGFCE